MPTNNQNIFNRFILAHSACRLYLQVVSDTVLYQVLNKQVAVSLPVLEVQVPVPNLQYHSKYCA